jgi:hypothetical protein
VTSSKLGVQFLVTLVTNRGSSTESTARIGLLRCVRPADGGALQKWDSGRALHMCQGKMGRNDGICSQGLVFLVATTLAERGLVGVLPRDNLRCVESVNHCPRQAAKPMWR